MDIEEVLLKCNVMRENEEGIGLSDALLRIVEFAYYAGYNQNSIDRFLKMKVTSREFPTNSEK
jgi:hypothetical protein|tara:strand:- start:253 stop:441 length:189 start_codon:yes stop_codon:yes gene_type:complete